MAMNRKERRRAKAMGTPAAEPEARRVGIAVGPTTWSVRLFALFGALAGMGVGVSMFAGELASGTSAVMAEAVGKCLGALVLGAVAGAFMAIGRNVANR
ncbi:MAG: hypothetical protein JO055_15275 [Alphaproteobacteria bacterium]|nr:hypothetical protein [Alphaproteobacteria bacterium]